MDWMSVSINSRCFWILEVSLDWIQSSAISRTLFSSSYEQVIADPFYIRLVRTVGEVGSPLVTTIPVPPSETPRLAEPSVKML